MGNFLGFLGQIAPAAPVVIDEILTKLGAAWLSRSRDKFQQEAQDILKNPVGYAELGNTADQITTGFINTPVPDSPEFTRSPIPTIAPQPRREGDTDDFPAFYVPDWSVDPNQERKWAKPPNTVKRRIPNRIDFENGFDPNVQPEDKRIFDNGVDPPVEYVPEPTQTIALPPPEIRHGEIIKPPITKDRPVYRICNFEPERDINEMLAEGQALYEAQSIGMVREDREDYQLEDSMALLFDELTTDADGNVTVNTTIVYGHDAITHLLYAPLAQAQSVSFPVGIVTLSEQVEFKTCNRTLKINNEIPPTQPKDCCQPATAAEGPVIDECFIPVRNFKSNEPNGKGYRNQLQIVFTDGKTNTARKELTIPNPKDEVDAALINLLLQPHLDNGGIYFGLIKCEFDMLPWGYLRYYASSKEEGEKLLRSMADLSKNAIKPKSYRSSDRPDRDNDIGLYKPDRAYLLEFEKGVQVGCKRFDLT